MGKQFNEGDDVSGLLSSPSLVGGSRSRKMVYFTPCDVFLLSCMLEACTLNQSGRQTSYK